MKEQEIARTEFTNVMHREFDAGRGISLRVTGSSMEPLLRHLRDSVVLVSPRQQNPVLGDVVLFHRESGQYIMHRIIRDCGDGTYIINGDAQIWTEIIRKDQIDAVVAAFVRKGRYFSYRNVIYKIYLCVWGGLRPCRRLIFSAAGKIKRCIVRKNER